MTRKDSGSEWSRGVGEKRGGGKAVGEKLKELYVPQLAAATGMKISAGLNTAPAAASNHSSSSACTYIYQAMFGKGLLKPLLSLNNVKNACQIFLPIDRDMR